MALKSLHLLGAPPKPRGLGGGALIQINMQSIRKSIGGSNTDTFDWWPAQSVGI